MEQIAGASRGTLIDSFIAAPEWGAAPSVALRAVRDRRNMPCHAS